MIEIVLQTLKNDMYINFERSLKTNVLRFKYLLSWVYNFCPCLHPYVRLKYTEIDVTPTVSFYSDFFRCIKGANNVIKYILFNFWEYP